MAIVATVYSHATSNKNLQKQRTKLQTVDYYGANYRINYERRVWFVSFCERVYNTGIFYVVKDVRRERYYMKRKNDLFVRPCLFILVKYCMGIFFIFFSTTCTCSRAYVEFLLM